MDQPSSRLRTWKEVSSTVKKKRGDSAVRSTRTGRRSSVFFFSTLCACCKNAWMWNLSSINVSRQSKVQAGAVGLEVLYILESCWVRVFLFFFPLFFSCDSAFIQRGKFPWKRFIHGEFGKKKYWIPEKTMKKHCKLTSRSKRPRH